MHSTDLTERRQTAKGSLLERQLAELIALDWEKALYLGIIVVAIVTRFWDLGARALHHDESLHATYSYYLYTGRGYTHDPLLHGTFIYHLNAFVYLLFGASDATARFAPAFLGVLTVGLPFFLRRELGRRGALVASALLLISPSFMYFGRFIREDAHFAFLTLAIVVCIFRYLESRKPLHLYLFAALFALSFLTKETTYILAATFGSFLVLWVGGELLELFRRQPRFSAAGDVLIVLGTLTATQLGGLAILYRHLQGRAIEAYPGAEDFAVLGVAFCALVALATIIGLRWNPRLWPMVALVFFVVYTVFFTTMFSNPAGFFTGAIGGLVYWLAQQEVKRGAQPWYYYLLLLPLYEYLVLVFAIPGAVYYLLRRTLFSTFLIYWSVVGLVIYSWAGEKMPWLILHVALPIVLLAAKFLGHLLDSARWRERWRERGLLVGGGLIALAITVALWSQPRPWAAGLSSLRAQQLWLQWAFLAILLVAAAYAALRAGERLGGRGSALTLAVGSLVVLVPLTVHTATQVSFTNGDVAKEMLVYTQTTPDVTKVVQELERIGFRTGAGRDLKVAYDSDVTWPFEWYLREYRSRNFYGNGTPAADAPVVLVGLEGNNDARIRPLLGNRYVAQRYRLRWWFPEDYQSPDAWLRAITPESKRASLPSAPREVGFLDILRASLQPEARERLWRYFLFRETLNPLGSTDFMLYVRKDLVGGGWVPASVAMGVAPAEDPFAKKTREVAAARVLGAEAGMVEPKNVAVAGDGSVFVLDAGAGRVLHFGADGRLLTQWGATGTGPGQFQEPWGIAVDKQGHVFVADTWNHRIQKFDSAGRFLLQWGSFGDNRSQAGGSPGLFYGPRGLAVDGDGNLLVVDTGNKRVQKFSPDGVFLAQFGGPGGAEGLFNEPVGIAVDGEGNIYVADTWNHRIQKFDSRFGFLAQWEVPAWLSESVVNKPFLAVDQGGNVVASDPEAHRLFKLDRNGQVLVVWGRYGGDEASLNLPLGVAVDAGGNVYVADSENRRIVVYPPVE